MIKKWWYKVPIGTRSVLIGAHCAVLHPFFVAAAWWMLYGFPLDPRLWVAFFVHDLGYVGKPDMDGEEGETHVEFGAMFMNMFFDKGSSIFTLGPNPKWHNLCLYHSRFYSKKAGVQFSRLCVADKLAFVLTPDWVYMPMVKLTGELDEYMKMAQSAGSKYENEQRDARTPEVWRKDLKKFIVKWVVDNQDNCAPA